MAPRLVDADHVLQRMADIGDDRQVDANILVHRRPVDIDMDLAAVRAERIEPARHAIVEARAEAEDQVRLVHRPIGFIGAVHAEHAEPLVGRGGEGAQAHQGRGDRRAGDPRQFAQQLARRRAGIDDAAAGIEDRALRRREHVDGLLDQRLVGLHLRAIGLVLDRARLDVARAGDLDVLGDVDHDRAGAARGRDVERLMDDVARAVPGPSPDNCAWSSGA